ncbi:MAG: hypothetical protein Fur0041_08310 [Bacteroidia bacterium]
MAIVIFLSPLILTGIVIDANLITLFRMQLIIFEQIQIHMHQPVSLADITNEEKEMLVRFARKKVMNGIPLYLGPFLLCALAVLYINLNAIPMGLNGTTLLEVLNFLLVVLAVLPARLFVNHILFLKKSAGAWQKKIVRGKIHGKEGHTIYVSGQKIRLNAEQASDLKNEDFVEVGMNTQGNFVLYIHKMPSES